MTQRFGGSDDRPTDARTHRRVRRRADVVKGSFLDSPVAPSPDGLSVSTPDDRDPIADGCSIESPLSYAARRAAGVGGNLTSAARRDAVGRRLVGNALVEYEPLSAFLPRVHVAAASAATVAFAAVGRSWR